eukprot:6189899-Pleurochrysis_carterae.AAC.5
MTVPPDATAPGQFPIYSDLVNHPRLVCAVTESGSQSDVSNNSGRNSSRCISVLVASSVLRENCGILYSIAGFDVWGPMVFAKSHVAFNRRYPNSLFLGWVGGHSARQLASQRLAGGPPAAA